jgi:hypothetical protein
MGNKTNAEYITPNILGVILVICAYRCPPRFPYYTGGNWVEWVVLLFFFALKILGQEILSENENNLRGNLK